MGLSLSWRPVQTGRGPEGTSHPWGAAGRGMGQSPEPLRTCVCSRALPRAPRADGRLRAEPSGRAPAPAGAVACGCPGCALHSSRAATPLSPEVACASARAQQSGVRREGASVPSARQGSRGRGGPVCALLQPRVSAGWCACGALGRCQEQVGDGRDVGRRGRVGFTQGRPGLSVALVSVRSGGCWSVKGLDSL